MMCWARGNELQRRHDPDRSRAIWATHIIHRNSTSFWIPWWPRTKYRFISSLSSSSGSKTLYLVPPPSPSPSPSPARLPIDAQAALRSPPVGRERGAPALPPAINSPHPSTAPPSSIDSSVVGCSRQAGRMFSLSQIEHDLPMPPHLLSRPLHDAIKAELERLFLDKVTRIVSFGFVLPLNRGISIVDKILFVVPAILVLNPFAHNIGDS